MGDHFFFNGWEPLLRTAVVGFLAYAALIVMLRISGKRTLSRLNAFDLVVTVALGSTLATILLSSDVALAQGTLAFGLLIGLQYLLAHLASRPGRVGHRVEGLVKSEPTLLLFRGEILDEAMRRERLTESEILAALRSGGYSGINGVEAVVLETDGSISVVPSPTGDTPEALQHFARYQPRTKATTASRATETSPAPRTSRPAP